MNTPSVACCRRTIVVLALVAVPHGITSAQNAATPLSARISAVRDGRVRMTFAARPGVCGNGTTWNRSRPGETKSWGSRDIAVSCETGPARLVVVREGGETTELRTGVGGTWRADAAVTDLGTVSAKAVGLWLVTLAESGSEKPARDAIAALFLTDSVDATQTLLRVAGSSSRPQDVRTQALFWLGEAAGDKATAALDSVAYEAGDREVRKQAIFAMSRRPTDEAVVNLVRMAETLPDRELRKTAIFWLARVKDPRALAWITKELDRTTTRR